MRNSILLRNIQKNTAIIFRIKINGYARPNKAVGQKNSGLI